MKNDNPPNLPVPENTQPDNIHFGNENMWDTVLKEAEESQHEENWILNLAFIY